ncbi:MAG TPA: sigma-70 family RNA polymerase sigma factor [Gemmataceae bacterium]|jgi:RNA polymerase sigma factor (sigma-70 family)
MGRMSWIDESQLPAKVPETILGERVTENWLLKLFVEHLAGPLCRWLTLKIRSEAIAEEAAAETGAQLIRTILEGQLHSYQVGMTIRELICDEFRRRGLLCWIGQVAWRHAMHQKRRERRKSDVEPGFWESLEAELTPLEIERREEIASVHKALDCLPLRHRTVLTLFYLEGKNYRQISTKLGITPKAVKSRLTRARAAIAKKLKRLRDAEL